MLSYFYIIPDEFITNGRFLSKLFLLEFHEIKTKVSNEKRNLKLTFFMLFSTLACSDQCQGLKLRPLS